jgi:hypothetical protein
MSTDYRDWIAENVKGTGYGDCAEATEAMQLTFPELRRVRGFYHDHLWGERQHWWLVAPDGRIVDPTAEQFPSKGTGEYVEYDGRPLPTGRCANCGGPVYDGSTCCSDDCGRAYVAWVCGNAATGRC